MQGQARGEGRGGEGERGAYVRCGGRPGRRGGCEVGKRGQLLPSAWRAHTHSGNALPLHTLLTLLK